MSNAEGRYSIYFKKSLSEATAANLQSSIFISGLSGLDIYCLCKALFIPMVKFSFFQSKSEAIFSPHRHANIIDRQAFTLETHGATSMGEILVPSNVIMDTFMTSNGHGIG